MCVCVCIIHGTVHHSDQVYPSNTLEYSNLKNKRYRYVDKRKISYFGLARYLIQHWISPNQDDLSYSARTFISG